MSRTRCFDTGQAERTSGEQTILRSGQAIYSTIRADIAANTWANTREIRVNTTSDTLESVRSADLLSRITKGYYDYQQRCDSTCYGSSEEATDPFNKMLITDVKDGTLDLTSASTINDRDDVNDPPLQMYPFAVSTTACQEYVYPAYEELSAGEATVNRKPIYRTPTQISFA